MLTKRVGSGWSTAINEANCTFAMQSVGQALSWMQVCHQCLKSISDNLADFHFLLYHIRHKQQHETLTDRDQLLVGMVLSDKENFLLCQFLTREIHITMGHNHVHVTRWGLQTIACLSIFLVYSQTMTISTSNGHTALFLSSFELKTLRSQPTLQLSASNVCF